MNMIIHRFILADIEKRLFTGKIIVLYGPRRVGKTTVVKTLQEKYASTKKTLYLSGDDIVVQQAMSSQSALALKDFLGDADLVFLDEAQRIRNIGINLKIIIDAYPEIQIVATGSSSFDLANEITEPLTGRKWEFFLPPLTIEELAQTYASHEIRSLLPRLLTYGCYPEVFTSGERDVQEVLQRIASDYLYKDILLFEGQKNSEILLKLLQLLAFQVGHEVSVNELATRLEISKSLVEKLIFLLEQTFVIFRLSPLKRNARNEVGKKKKIYFWDVGIRNALIQNFNSLDVRSDRGQLWENFCITERSKLLKNHLVWRKQYYWRTYEQKEIDYIEEYDGMMHPYEIKWKESKVRLPVDFGSAYKTAPILVVTVEQCMDFCSDV
jgi:predicted AAA+ superfamily ATPase